MKLTPCTEINTTTLFAFDSAPRCGARTRLGRPCKSPAIKTKQRCRMHGGKGSGAPKGSQNALKHGFHSKVKIIQRKKINDFIKTSNEFIKKNY